MITARLNKTKKSRRRSRTVGRRALLRMVDSAHASRMRTPGQTTRRTERSLNESASQLNEGI